MSTGAGTFWTLASLTAGLGSLGDVMLGLGAMVVFIAVLALWRKRLLARVGGEAAPSRLGPGRHRRGRVEAEALAADMEELTDRLVAVLDAKAVRLERLIEAADERLARLEAPAPQPAARTASAALRPHAAARDARRPDPLAWQDDSDPISREVYRLADGGLPTVEIAKRLDEQIGKVELILALREQ